MMNHLPCCCCRRLLTWIRPFRHPPNWYHNPRAALLIAGGSGAAVYYWTHHDTVPYTNRNRFILCSPSTERELLDFEGIKTFHRENGNLLPPDHPDSVRVRRVFDRIIHGARRSGTSILPDLFDWEAVVVTDDDSTAACFFAGKIIIYSGMLKICSTDTEIAWLISHEVGHAIARHTLEKVTKWIMFRIPYIFLLQPQFRFFIQNLARVLLTDMLSQLFIQLPLARRREMEADYIGLLLLASAGYDPRVVPKMFDKLGQEEISERKRLIYLLIRNYYTHPPDNKRSQLASQAMEEALAIYKKNITAESQDKPGAVFNGSESHASSSLEFE